MESSSNIEQLVETFKAIADESRLKIIAHISDSPATVGDLSELLDLKAPTVSHHLSTLRAAGLVTVRKEGTSHYYTFRAEGLTDVRRTLATKQGLKPFNDESGLATWEQKVLNTFTDGDQITQIPSSEKKRNVLVRWISEKFENGRDYPESEVNEIIKRHHVDSALFRRKMVDLGIMTRSNGIYRKVEA